MGSKKNIPEGWLSYSPLGNQIPGTFIICFKVPLKEEICRSMLQSERFTPSMLMNQVPNLVGVIDVTNTPRYYNRQVFLDKGIRHEKIQCPGHAVPPANVVDYFQKVMDGMWTVAEESGGVKSPDLVKKYEIQPKEHIAMQRYNKELSNTDGEVPIIRSSLPVGGKLVGVHCTHGINRTGYLVCRYLIECRGFPPEDAIRMFAESRGHGIERQNYLSDLRTLTPAHRSPNSISHAEFLKMEEQRRIYWNTDASNDSVRPRRDQRRNWRQPSKLPPMVHRAAATPAPLLPNPPTSLAPRPLPPPHPPLLHQRQFPAPSHGHQHYRRQSRNSWQTTAIQDHPSSSTMASPFLSRHHSHGLVESRHDSIRRSFNHNQHHDSKPPTPWLSEAYGERHQYRNSDWHCPSSHGRYYRRRRDDDGRQNNYC